MTWKRFETEKPEMGRWCWVRLTENFRQQPMKFRDGEWASLSFTRTKNKCRYNYYLAKKTDEWQYAEVPE